MIATFTRSLYPSIIRKTWFRGLMSALGLVVWLITIKPLLPNYLYGFDHFGYAANAVGQNVYGFAGGWGYDDTFPVLQDYLVERGLTATTASFDFGFFLTPPSFFCGDDQTGELINQYPPGFPLMLRPFVGSDWFLYWVNPALLALWAIIVLVVIPRNAFIIAVTWAAMMLSSPLIINNATEVTADISSMILLTTSIMLVILTASPTMMLVAGCISGLSMLVRYPNVIVSAALGAILLSRVLGSRGSVQTKRALVYYVLTTTICGALPLLSYLITLLGLPVRTTYLYYDPLALRYIPTNLLLLFDTIVHAGVVSQLQVVLAIIYCIMCIMRGGASRRMILEGAVPVMAIIFFYASYIPDNFDSRYYLPVAAMIMAAAAAGIVLIIERTAPRRLQCAVWVLFITILLCLSVKTADIKKRSTLDHRLFSEIRTVTGDSAVVFCSGWSGTLRHYCGLRTCRWTWAPLEVVDCAANYFVDREVPLFLLIDQHSDQERGLRDFMARRFVLEQKFIHDHRTSILLYHVLGRAEDAGLEQGLVIPWGGSSLQFANFTVTASGPPLLIGLSLFADRGPAELSPDGLTLSGPWAGIECSLLPDYPHVMRHGHIELAFSRGTGDVVVQGFRHEDASITKHLSLDNPLEPHVIVIPLDEHWQGVTRLRIQNDDDFDTVVLREIRVSPETDTAMIRRYHEIRASFRTIDRYVIDTDGKPAGTRERWIMDPDLLSHALNARDSRIRVEALLAILAANPPLDRDVVLSELVSCIDDPYYLVRSLVLDILVKNDRINTIENDILATLLDDEMAIVRRKAAAILLDRGDDRPVPVLTRDLGSDNYWEMKAAEKILNNTRKRTALRE